ncbi:eb630e2a-64e3-4cb4-b1a1-5d7626be9e89 [Sclerotinia trifoliorum]|uniref:Mitochondrial transcription factor 1 n=1 Tax=Sclerotinia trifoliorum TaxID=28548 RepID=A0A8H2VQR2_9HELO|nr:eb630e2a-64e3-4cb4-b1a1-5d7626be9e89 [Sclerotinia trifoliorum]
MFRIYSRSCRSNLLKCPVILQHSRLRQIHCSSSLSLPKTSKSSDILTSTDEDPPAKRTRRKTVTSKTVEETDASLVKAKKSEGRKSVTSEGVEGEDESAVKPVKRRRKKLANDESVEGEDAPAMEPVKRRRKKLVNDASVEGQDETAAKPVKRRSKKLINDESVEGEDAPAMEPVKRRRKKLVNDASVEGQDETAAKPVKRRSKKLAEGSLEGKDGTAVEIVKLKQDRPEQAIDFEPEFEEEAEEEPEDDVEANREEFIKISPALRTYLSKAHLAGSAMGDRTRVNILNEALCDDIIDRFGSSLLKHTGCDIIDINPGLGIWSSKIHDLLKPRTHLLMEPDAKKYLPYLQPLLDAEGSTYRHIPKSGTVWEHLRHVTTPEFLPHQVKLSPDDPKINEPNSTLLVIANLAHHPRKKYRGFESMSQLVMYQLLAAARSHALFHEYGLIRMLIWIPDVEKTSWLTRHIAQMRKNAVEAQITTKYIREIASSTVDNHRFVRDSEFALNKSIDVVRNMDKMGITTPKHRQGPMEVAARQSLATGGHRVKSEDFERFRRGWIDEYEDLQRRWDEGTLNQYEEKAVEENPVENVKNSKPGKEKRNYTEEYARYIFLKSKKRVINIHGLLTEQLINDHNNINELHSKIMKEDSSLGDIEKSKHEIKAMIKTYEDKIANLPLAAFKIYTVRLDGARIRMEFEKREVEPLKVYAKEFRPHTELCLLDIEPQALWPILRQDYPQNYDVFEYIIGSIFAHPADTVYESLENLWPGALEFIADKCPSLTDPSKGGSFDLKHLSARCLTTEMLKEIMEAWMKWPFRPSRFELMTKSGSMVHDPDNLEDDLLEGP